MFLLSLIIHFALKSHMSDTEIARPVLLCLLLVRYFIFHSVIFSMSVFSFKIHCINSIQVYFLIQFTDSVK